MRRKLDDSTLVGEVGLIQFLPTNHLAPVSTQNAAFNERHSTQCYRPRCVASRIVARGTLVGILGFFRLSPFLEATKPSDRLSWICASSFTLFAWKIIEIERLCISQNLKPVLTSQTEAKQELGRFPNSYSTLNATGRISKCFAQRRVQHRVLIHAKCQYILISQLFRDYKSNLHSVHFGIMSLLRNSVDCVVVRYFLLWLAQWHILSVILTKQKQIYEKR